MHSLRARTLASCACVALAVWRAHELCQHRLGAWFTVTRAPWAARRHAGREPRRLLLLCDDGCSSNADSQASAEAVTLRLLLGQLPRVLEARCRRGGSHCAVLRHSPQQRHMQNKPGEPASDGSAPLAQHGLLREMYATLQADRMQAGLHTCLPFISQRNFVCACRIRAARPVVTAPPGRPGLHTSPPPRSRRADSSCHRCRCCSLMWPAEVSVHKRLATRNVPCCTRLFHQALV